MKEIMKPKFFVCINNEGYQASLEKRKLYQVVEDESAEGLNMIRVIDESGEDYLYPSNYFLGVKLNKVLEESLLMA
jgi:hypothetical protein